MGWFVCGMVIGMIKTIRFILVILFWLSILRLNCLNGRRGFVVLLIPCAIVKVLDSIRYWGQWSESFGVVLKCLNYRFVILELMRNGEMWGRLLFRYLVDLVMWMTMVFFIGWRMMMILKQLLAFTRLILWRKRWSPCQFQLVCELLHWVWG